MKTLLLAAGLVLLPPKAFPTYMPTLEYQGGGFALDYYVGLDEDAGNVCVALYPDLAPKPGTRILACSGQRVSVLPNPCSPQYADESFAAVVCHEKAHQLFGWKHP